VVDMCEITIDCIYIVYGFICLCIYWFCDGYIKGIKKHMKNKDVVDAWVDKMNGIRDLTLEQNARTKGNEP